MDIKYDNHKIAWELATSIESHKRTAEAWFKTGTVYRWLNDRRMRLIYPLIDTFPECSWVTVGDGRYGLDASHIISKAVLHVHATDVDDTLLKIGKEKGVICSFSEENAEQLSFADDSFDFALCKDALHHCPRPYHALWEMLRIVRSCVVVMEPTDLSQPHEFETVGNFVYRLTIRDYEKFLLGLHLRWIAYRGYNDYHEEGVEHCPMEGGSAEEQALRDRSVGAVLAADRAVAEGREVYPWHAVALFKCEPSELMVSALTEAGWTFKVLPKNPHIRRYAA
jgi:SAM-dependent methyltransferase